mmetsp:Transcript_15399/g.34398  ORF Transcript_15399/g.34398 Transcript_15399/m.34398 type:complete len:636 (-) Transcript_15399:714-2621(-)
MISAVEWVPMGAADPNPKRYELSKAEMEMLEEQAGMEADLEEEEDANDDDDSSASPDTNEASETTGVKLEAVDISTLPADLRMDDYSEDEDDAQAEGRLGNILIGKETELMGTNLDRNGMPVEDIDEEKGQRERERDDAEDSSDDDDDDDDIDNDANDSDDDLADVPDTREFMPVDVRGLEAMGLSAAGLGGAMNEEDDDDDASDLEDTNLRPDDAMVVVAKTDEDFASLEVHVYESRTGNLFVHHDIPLPSFPLCLAHGDINPDGGAGNFIAVGSFSPSIEVWNLDVLSALEPVAILGGEDTSGADELMRINMARAAAGKKLKKKKVGQQGSGLRPGSHKDAVMALSWNKVHRQVLASGSADKTVKVWDITQAGNPNACAATFVHHKDKVQSVAWHPSEGTILATGSFDRTVSLVDARSNDGKNYRKATLPADCEAIAWDPFESQYLSAASEDGTITCWDVRKFDQKLWSFVAHEYGGVSDLAYNANVPGMMATCAIDKTVKLWDTGCCGGNSGSVPSVSPMPCGSRDMGVGKLYTISFYPSTPWLLGCGGSGNQLSLWDLSSEGPIRKRFGDRIDNADAVQETLADAEPAGNKEKDFEAMMAAGDAAASEKLSVNKNRKKKGQKKKKAHRAGR